MSKECQFKCGKSIHFEGKTNERGSTGWFEDDEPHFEHTYNRCNKLKRLHLEKYKPEDKNQSKLTKWYD